ncbi:MAG TPA: hypothetical protein VNJ11_09745 [Bryobacteraceae bacterium]|nr:hypothetical protein [Bryobacteraceae bacterium]
MLSQVGIFYRFATGLGRFLRTPLSAEQCRAIVADSLAGRERNFLRLVHRAVYGYPESPYRQLLLWAGVEYGDLERMVQADGIERTLERLFDAGVFVELDEFKGRRPIRRPGLTVEVTAESFDNPLLARDFEVESGGSTGPRRRMKIDFDLLVYDAACRHFHFAAVGAESAPLAIWRGVPPDSSGLKHGLIAAKLGRPMERWFSPVPLSFQPRSLPFAALTLYAVKASPLFGSRIPAPEHVPLSDGRPVARWLAEKVRQGRPGVLSAAANNVVRACVAAKEAGLDVAGTIFRVSGEPFTEAKRRLVAELGARTFSGWSMSETGPLGGGCAHREVVDEVHLFRGKIAVFDRPKLLADGETQVRALYLTTLLPCTPKIMLNLDTGDYGVLSRRRCGCLLEQIGFTDHLHTIRNYEKLTAGGIQFLGSDIIRLVEEVLPAAHGGHPTDYQFVEEQNGALTEVSLIVSPRVPLDDEQAVVNTVLRFLAARDAGHRLMTAFWQQGRTLRVLRREPYVTAASKTPPLRVIPK